MKSATTHTVANIAARYGVSEHTVLGWIKTGELRAVNVGRSARGGKPRWRVTVETLEAFERARTSSTTPAIPPRPKRLPAVPRYI